MSTDPTPTPIDLDAIRAREQAATPGPWGWRGHISSSVELRALHSGGLRIISTSRGEPCIGLAADESLVLMSNACKTCTHWLTDGGIGRGDDLKCEKPENLDTVWTWDPRGFIRPINDWAKAEVLQWSNHMYRDDVKGTTHPDAEFIAAARQDVPRLLDEVARLTAERDRADVERDSLSRRLGVRYEQLGQAIDERDQARADLAEAQATIATLRQVATDAADALGEGEPGGVYEHPEPVEPDLDAEYAGRMDAADRAASAEDAERTGHGPRCQCEICRYIMTHHQDSEFVRDAIARQAVS